MEHLQQFLSEKRGLSFLDASFVASGDSRRTMIHTLFQF